MRPDDDVDTLSGSAGHPKGMPLSDILALQPLRRAHPQLMAGESALDRLVRWAHVFDHVDVRGLLRGGEFILSTGSPLGEDERVLRGFVDDLADEGAAALGIELGGAYAQELPGELVRRARQRELPLFAFRRRVRFAEITEAIHHALIDQTHEVRRRAAPLLEAVDAVALAGGGVQEFIDTLAGALGAPVILEDIARGITAFNAAGFRQDRVLDAFQSARNANDPSGMITMSVRRSGAVWGDLSAFEFDAQLDARLARELVERTALMISLCLARGHDDTVARGLTRGEFLGNLGKGQFSRSSAEESAIALGADRAGHPLFPVALAWQGAKRVPEGWGTLARRIMRSPLSERPLMAGQVGDELLVIVPAASPESTERILAQIRETTADEMPPGTVNIAQGPLTGNWADLGRRLRPTAISALTAGPHTGAGFVDGSLPNADWLLYELADGASAAKYTEHVLAPLLRHDRTHGSDLVRTLAEYLSSGRKKTAAAESLRLNRQSLYDRLGRIAALLDADIDEPDIAFALELAIRLRAHRG